MSSLHSSHTPAFPTAQTVSRRKTEYCAKCYDAIVAATFRTARQWWHGRYCTNRPTTWQSYDGITYDRDILAQMMEGTHFLMLKPDRPFCANPSVQRVTQTPTP